MSIKLYDRFQGNELKIAELILRRRLQIYVHSYLYYELDESLIADTTWDRWARELKCLQEVHPDISRQVPLNNLFEFWDASSGFNMPYDHEIRRIGQNLLAYAKQREE